MIKYMLAEIIDRLTKYKGDIMKKLLITILAMAAMIGTIQAKIIDRPFDISKYPINCTGYYGEQRGEYMHAGVDYSLNEDSELIAPCTGTVKAARWFKGYGNTVQIDAGDIVIDGVAYNIIVLVAHLNEIIVRKGDEITQGQLIGLSGNTGTTRGAHTHYEVRLRNLDTGRSFTVCPRMF